MDQVRFGLTKGMAPHDSGSQNGFASNQPGQLGTHSVESPGSECANIVWPPCFDMSIPVSQIPTTLPDRNTQQNKAVQKQLPNQSQAAKLKLTFKLKTDEHPGTMPAACSLEGNISDDESFRSFSSEASGSDLDEPAAQACRSGMETGKNSDIKPSTRFSMAQAMAFVNGYVSDKKPPETDLSDNSDDEDVNSFSAIKINPEKRDGLVPDDVVFQGCSSSEASKTREKASENPGGSETSTFKDNIVPVLADKESSDNRETEDIKCAEEYVIGDAHYNELGEFDSEKIKTQQGTVLAAIKAGIFDAIEKDGSVYDEMNAFLSRYPQAFPRGGNGRNAFTNDAGASEALPGETDAQFARRLSQALNRD